jgi:hypothetical protein
MLLRRLHLTWTDCAIGAEFPDTDCHWLRSLHHIHRHPRDDVQGNLIMLCGDGTRGHHGLVEARDPRTIKRLGYLVRFERPDTLRYLTAKLGDAEKVNAWLTRYL